MFKTVTGLMLLSLIISSCSTVKVSKDINYVNGNDTDFSLNIYHQNSSDPQDVIIFVHGGSWGSGKKETYWWLGRNFAKKGVVTAVINYPLAPKVTYKEMALATAQSVKLVQDSIAKYGGNPKRIFLMGHSAGAHLIELINADPQYYKKVGIENPAKGLILNDAFGLDMFEYMTKADKDLSYDNFVRTFTNNPAIWKLGSPLQYAQNITNPHLLFYGANTYPAIKIQTSRLNNMLKLNNVPVEMNEIRGKKHVGMMAQMVFGGNQLYGKILVFMKGVK